MRAPERTIYNVLRKVLYNKADKPMAELRMKIRVTEVLQRRAFKCYHVEI